MTIENVVVEYTKRVDDVPVAGHVRLKVRISEQPIFEGERSMTMRFYADHDSPTRLGDSSTISYRSVKAENYRQRMEVDIYVPPQGTRVGAYKESRDAAVKALPDIIQEHERRMKT